MHTDTYVCACMSTNTVHFVCLLEVVCVSKAECREDWREGEPFIDQLEHVLTIHIMSWWKAVPWWLMASVGF